MKLIIQIPCYNEEESLPITLSALPIKIPGIDVIETLVIDDGSEDRTAEVAKQYGVKHIVSFSRNRGLARGFMAGLQKAIAEGADIIVNTDADNQYHGQDIEDLVRPILEKKAEMVIGTRPVMSTQHFSIIKKYLQFLGSFVVRVVSRTKVQDAPSGFRAFSREAAMQLRVFSAYTYTLETLIQAGHKGISVMCVPVRTNKDLRSSRLVSSLTSYVWKSMLIICRIFVVYRPFRFFLTLGAVVFCMGFLIASRYLWIYIHGQGGAHIQSLILASLLMMLGYLTTMIGVLADLIAVNRKLLEEICFRFYRVEELVLQQKSKLSESCNKDKI